MVKIDELLHVILHLNFVRIVTPLNIDQFLSNFSQVLVITNLTTKTKYSPIGHFFENHGATGAPYYRLCINMLQTAAHLVNKTTVVQ